MGFDPPAQSDTSYEEDALPPSHHGWIIKSFNKLENIYFKTKILSCYLGEKFKNKSSDKNPQICHQISGDFWKKKIARMLRKLPTATFYKMKVQPKNFIIANCCIRIE